MRLNNGIYLFLCLTLAACSSHKTQEQPESAQTAQIQAEALALQAQEAKQRFSSALSVLRQTDASEAQLREAQQQFMALYQSNPRYLGALINAADISFRLKEVEQAETRYQQVLSSLSQPPEQEDRPADMKSDQAERPFEMTSSQLDFKVHALNQLGLMAREQGKFDDAERYYREALHVQPDNKVVIRNLAILLDLYRGKLAEALALYEQYQSSLDEPDSQIKDWIFDVRNRLPEEASNE